MSNSSTQPAPVSAIIQYNEYRCYLTPEYWLITYRDADFIRIMRAAGHRPGFALILLELCWDLCRGKRTELRDRWAIHGHLASDDAKQLILQQRAATNSVIEFWFEKKGKSTSRADAKQESET